MTYIVSLAHFCEVHGPSMIMCTQAVENPEELPSLYSPQLSESQFCQSCMLKIPYVEDGEEDTDLGHTKAADTETSTITNTSSGSTVRNSNGNSSQTTVTLEDQISNLLSPSLQSSQQRKRPMTLKSKSNRSSNINFVSTQFPTYTERYSSLRQTIVRVFTAETNADLSKPIMFGNSKHGYSIALSFSLLDKTARGSERKYSIIVTSNWEKDIINNYTFILTNLNQVVGNILKKAKMVQKQLNLSTDELHNNDTYLRRSAGLPKAKSMVEILKDENFFLKIHMWAAFMLDTLMNQKDATEL